MMNMTTPTERPTIKDDYGYTVSDPDECFNAGYGAALYDLKHGATEDHHTTACFTGEADALCAGSHA